MINGYDSISMPTALEDAMKDHQNLGKIFQNKDFPAVLKENYSR